MMVMDRRRCRPDNLMSKRIATRCPETGRVVTTETQCDGESFARIPFIVAIESCPACGAAHSWRKSETFLAEALAAAA
jgi:endogenous inhibitor of DNA gyrase (YacG/DUF329 family)